MLHRLPFLPPELRHKLARAAALRRYNTDAKQGSRRAIAQFEKRHGYKPDFDTPTTHNERTYVRKLMDHDPRFPQLTDKGTARTYIDSILGTGNAVDLCVPILAHVRQFQDIPNELWAQDLMLKATHGSGMNHVVRAHDDKARRSAKRRFRKWFGQVHGARRFEWCYLGLCPSIIVEPLLQDGPLRDLKLYYYDGVLRFLMPEDNSGPVPAISMYTPEWDLLPIQWQQFGNAPSARPAQLSEIIEIATPLAAGFDMIRIDFLLTKDRYYLGELTLYDASGLATFDSYQNDKAFAAHWRQPHLGFDQN